MIAAVVIVGCASGRPVDRCDGMAGSCSGNDLSSCKGSPSSNNFGQPVVRGDPIASTANPQRIDCSLTGHAAAVLDNSLVIVGGIWGPKNESLLTPLQFRLPEVWCVGSKIGTARDFAGMAEVAGRVYVVGGTSRDELCMGDVLSWDGRTPEWRNHALLPTPRNRLACVGHQGFLYAIGGMDRHGNSAACERYDPTADRWTTLAPMPTPRHGHAAVVAGDLIIVLGGEAGPAAHGPVEAFDTTTGKWEAWPSMPADRLFFGAVFYRKSIYAFGGHADESPVSWRFDLTSRTWSPGTWPPMLGRGRFAWGVLEEEQGRPELVIVGGERADGGPVDPGLLKIPFESQVRRESLDR